MSKNPVPPPAPERTLPEGYNSKFDVPTVVLLFVFVVSVMVLIRLVEKGCV